MTRQRYTTGQAINWCLKVIHREAINAKRRYIRWSRDALVINRTLDDGSEWGDLLACPKSQKDERNKDVMLLIENLPPKEKRVIYGLFVRGLTQSELSKNLDLSQQSVSRLKTRGIKRLREAMSEKAMSEKAMSG
ncbi:sigma-70 family RNA polymerase sigma factor [Alicyclobacillus sp. SO9]|uniref:sigma-70 family RNA polymerase sigma factor n=1 Tax=Alicyclobacillus sp. SO9 TaxID=2665646 RepID=UPI0018E74FC6|nr:sigma-70 family RNA polymerase sigma factor [Alicyclobacillus sp. SO9]QQE78699.1 sigma-70 family RNA polymerase sigma factor [Alicyclobacillus sp. SO9]